MCVDKYGVIFNSRVVARLGHARRRSLNWSGGVCCHHCRGASDEPPSSPLQSPPPLKPPHQRRRARPGIEPGLHACVRRRRCLRWRRGSRRRQQQQQRRRGVYLECTYVGWLVARPAALAAALAQRGHRARPRGRPRERGVSAARGRRATCRHEVNVCSFRLGFFRCHHRARAQDNFRLYLSAASSGSVQVRLRFGFGFGFRRKQHARAHLQLPCSMFTVEQRVPLRSGGRVLRLRATRAHFGIV